MNELISKSSLQILESLSFTQTLYAFDFDGTLAPIVDNPDDAYMKESTQTLLARLSKMVSTAVISGRGLADLSPRVPESVRYLIGNHGLEGLPGATPIAHLRSQSQGWKKFLEAHLNPVAQDLGISIEDKEYSIALHYRRSRKRKLARIKIQETIPLLDGNPRILFGKLVFNVIPAGGPHKGIALQRLMEQSGSKFAFYIGDDFTDEDIFGLLDSRILTVRVGKKDRSQAKYYIHKQKEIDAVIQKIIQFHDSRGL